MKVQGPIALSTHSSLGYCCGLDRMRPLRPWHLSALSKRGRSGNNGPEPGGTIQGPLSVLQDAPATLFPSSPFMPSLFFPSRQEVVVGS